MNARGEATRQAILDYLVREADLDGLVTVSENEVAAAVGVQRKAADTHLQALKAAGAIVATSRTDGVQSHSVNAYQLAESVIS